jgi:hypothetical protein
MVIMWWPPIGWPVFLMGVYAGTLCLRHPQGPRKFKSSLVPPPGGEPVLPPPGEDSVLRVHPGEDSVPVPFPWPRSLGGLLPLPGVGPWGQPEETGEGYSCAMS